MATPWQLKSLCQYEIIVPPPTVIWSSRFSEHVTAGDNRNETVAATNPHQVFWYLLWTPPGAVGGVGTVGAANDKLGDARIHALSELLAMLEVIVALILR